MDHDRTAVVAPLGCRYSVADTLGEDYVRSNQDRRIVDKPPKRRFIGDGVANHPRPTLMSLMGKHRTRTAGP